jgi:hypothetical protein
MIEYIFTMDNGTAHKFQVDIDRTPSRADSARPPAFWTAMQFNQCTNCPLKADAHPYCPAALDIEEIAQYFRDISSFESVTVEVKTAERTYIKYCDVQTGLRALLGLVMATSACPITSQLKALTYYHLPFANIEETVFRAVSAYLLKQYFIHKAGGAPDLELKGLNQLYQNLQEINCCFKKRLDLASENDANMNAISALNFLSVAVAYSLEDTLQRLRPQFQDGSNIGNQAGSAAPGNASSDHA